MFVHWQMLFITVECADMLKMLKHVGVIKCIVLPRTKEFRCRDDNMSARENCK